jgi:hypothetical protein
MKQTFRNWFYWSVFVKLPRWILYRRGGRAINGAVRPSRLHTILVQWQWHWRG